jgi:hypothetical protein
MRLPARLDSNLPGKSDEVAVGTTLAEANKKPGLLENHQAMGGVSERYKEIKRRRKRRQQIARIGRRAAKASQSEKEVLAGKLRRMTSGADTLIERLQLERK